MPPSTSSTPISIPTSSPIAIHRRDSSSDDDDDSDSIGERRQHRTALNESDSVAELQVGSLPMHLRRPGRSSNSNNNRMRQYHTNNSSDQLQQFMGAMSLPPPRAPFISARQDMDNKLSSMPEIELPESVASTDPDLSSSVPFGSLRESQFTHPHLDRWQQSSSNNSYQQTTTQFQPQSLPAYASTGSGGIGSFFPESNNAASSETNRNMLNESSGIGGLLEGSRDGDNNNNYSRDIAGITNDYNQLTLDGSGRPYAESNDQRNITFDNGRPYGSTDDVNLSRSLTALDMMTRIRQTAPLAPPSQLERLESNGVDSSSNSNLTGLMEQQQQQYNAAQSPVGGNEQHYDHHADPDMFEAFDFELDE